MLLFLIAEGILILPSRRPAPELTPPPASREEPEELPV
jgi:hypothetical protein